MPATESASAARKAGFAAFESSSTKENSSRPRGRVVSRLETFHKSDLLLLAIDRAQHASLESSLVEAHAKKHRQNRNADFWHFIDERFVKTLRKWN
jgi:hypothetical protein